MHSTRLARLAPALALAGLVAACADTPTALRSPQTVRPGLASGPPSLAVTGGPDLSDYKSFQGQVWICKDGNQTGVSFNFDYRVVRASDNSLIAQGSTTVPVGQCVLATSVTTAVGGRYVATATETSVLPNWTLTDIDWAYGANLPVSPPPPTIDLATRTVSAVLIANDVGVQLTFTNTFTPPPPTGEIGDYVWYDVNGNGVQDGTEAGIPGVTVTLSGAASGTTTTDANGFYNFGGLGAGSYTVTVATPAGYVASPSNQGGDPTKDSNGSPASVTLATDASVDQTIDFGFTNGTGEIGDFVWFDVNGNGVQDGGEGGIAGVLVTLSGAASGPTTTNANGYYSFGGLSAGSYTVTVATPAGYNASPSNQGGDPTKDSNGSPASVTLAANNSIDLTIDFGFVAIQGPACTLTQGYWKNHTEEWDQTGEKVFKSTDTFYNSGRTYISIMNTPPKGGNAYLQLAHQFIAARLNTNGGPSGVASVDAALAGAAAYFASAPAGIPSPSGALRTQLQGWATTLDNYNNGLTGPGHCGS